MVMNPTFDNLGE
jgi:dUTP pyrophosphatase